MISIVFPPLFFPARRPDAVTHSEMTHWLPSPEGVGYSSCAGEMAEEPIPDRLRAALDARRGGARTELWRCLRCRYTLRVDVDPRGSRRIRNGYPAAALPVPAAGKTPIA